ncbi:MAG: amidinotransferase [Myxococcales bacterium]|nr:amidinotransferase [Myxococcales bacterium]
MGATFLMSYPAAKWQIRGGENFRSKTRASTNPRAAMQEWLKLCDAITKHGGRILVMPPAGTEPPLTGMMYTANAGAMFKVGDSWTWMLSKMSVAHRQAEQAPIKAFWAEAGVPTTACPHTWEGQADVANLPGNRFLLSWGVRSVKESVDEVKKHLPPGARVLDLKLRDPWFHGDTCMDAMVTRGGDTVLLAFGGALVDRTIPELRNFLGNQVEVLALDEADCLGYAANALCVDGTVLMPTGLSTGLRGNILKRGFNIEELDLPELFGKGGGGPRCLVNELRGFVLTSDAPDYVSQRDQLHALAERYPESAEKAP